MVSLLYALAAYLLFFATFLYAIGFTRGFWVPQHLDGPGAWTLLQAMRVNAALLALFAVWIGNDFGFACLAVRAGNGTSGLPSLITEISPV